MFRIALLTLGLLIGSAVSAQDTLMAVYGTILDIITNEPVKDSRVMAYGTVDSLPTLSVNADPEGRYMLGIFQERTYRILFTAPGYVPKQVLVEMDGPTAMDWKHGYGLSVDMSLYRDVEGLDLTMDDLPVGKATYDRSQDVFEWDKTYSRSISSRQKELLKEYKRRVPK